MGTRGQPVARLAPARERTGGKKMSRPAETTGSL